MRSALGGIVAAALLAGALPAAGCKVAYRTTHGNATAPAGMSSGTTSSITIGDEGGLLTMALLRAGLVGLGLATAYGSIQNPTVKTETHIESRRTSGDTLVTTTTREATIVSGPAEAGLGIMNADLPTVTSRHGGLSTQLELARRWMGGDTSGWMFKVGYAFRWSRGTGDLLAGLRGFAGIGYGKHYIEDRMLARVDRGPPELGDGRFVFAGVPARVGAFVGKRRGPDAILPYLGAEVFAQADLNLSEEKDDAPTLFMVGLRFNYWVLYVEGQLATSSHGRSGGIELGVGW